MERDRRDLGGRFDAQGCSLACLRSSLLLAEVCFSEGDFRTMLDPRDMHRRALRPLVEAALQADGLQAWANGVVTDALQAPDRQLKAGAITALEDYLLAQAIPSGLRTTSGLNFDLVVAFADEIQRICTDESISLLVSYNGVAWLLEGWRVRTPPRLSADDPLVILPACVAAGLGVHAAAFLAIEEGMRALMHLAGGLAPVREAAVLGLQRMLEQRWTRTLHELRRYALIGDCRQHAAALKAVSVPRLLTDRGRTLDALDLHHEILAAYRRLPQVARASEAGLALRRTLPETVARLLVAERLAGFAAAWAWLAWGDPDVSAIIQESIAGQPLASFEEAAFLRLNFS